MIGRRNTEMSTMHFIPTYKFKFQLQFSDAPFFFDRDESLPETKEASHFVVDLLAKMSIQPSLPRADCSLWKHGAEHCRTVCLARGSARMPAYHSMQVERGADLGLPGRVPQVAKSPGF